MECLIFQTLVLALFRILVVDLVELMARPLLIKQQVRTGRHFLETSQVFLLVGGQRLWECWSSSAFLEASVSEKRWLDLSVAGLGTKATAGRPQQKKMYRTNETSHQLKAVAPEQRGTINLESPDEPNSGSLSLCHRT